MASQAQDEAKRNIINSNFDQMSAIKSDILSVYDRFKTDIR